jgi:DNA-binding CsgD family transcriptional regulator
MAQLVPDESGLASLVGGEEQSWLRSMAGGMTVADLAESVGYSERAMFRLLRDLYRRIGVKNRTEALIWASRNSLLSDPTGDG